MTSAADPPLQYPSQMTGRATRWQLRTRLLELPARPLLMGIVNVTPDSFSDGGRFFDPQAAVAQGLQLAADGADILDVGGESTRPYSEVIDADEELRRVAPVVAALASQTKVPISIDTSKATVAREAIATGAEIINDVTALAGDADMVPLAIESQAGLCVMHMQGTPQTMQDDPRYDDVVIDVLGWLRRRRDELFAAGVSPERLALDPGVGFGKTHQHNLSLLAECYRLHELRQPILIGASRKAFIGKIIGDKQADRTAGTVGVAISLARQGVQILRVHNVAEVRQALLLFEATGGLDGRAVRL